MIPCKILQQLFCYIVRTVAMIISYQNSLVLSFHCHRMKTFGYRVGGKFFPKTEKFRLNAGYASPLSWLHHISHLAESHPKAASQPNFGLLSRVGTWVWHNFGWDSARGDASRQNYTIQNYTVWYNFGWDSHTKQTQIMSSF